MRRLGLSSFALLSTLLFSLAPGVRADDESSTPGALQVTGRDGTVVEMPLKHTSVSIEVSAFVARSTIEQTFANPFEEPVEAVYVFPLGDRAAVDDFEFVVGERTIRGEIRRREEARQIYDEARAAGLQAALLEQERPNIFTQSVANLEPGKEVKVRIRTVETLRYERGIYRLTFPLVVGPRYVPGGTAPVGAVSTARYRSTPAVPDAPRITPPVLKPGFRSGHDVSITVAIDAAVPLGSLSSPSHRILVDRPSPVSARVRLAPDDTIPNKDFLLRWNVSSERPAVGFLAHRDGLDGFFTLLVQPKGEIAAIEAAPKEIVMVIDTSGSMQGIPLDASQRFIAKALRELGPKDTFNLVRFSGDNEVYSKTPRPNTSSEVERAIEWVNRLSGAGGTEMLAALRAAFTLPPDPNRLRVVIFLTDGYIGNEQQILTEIRSVLGAARIHTVGIGSSVNHFLLDSMADVGNGAYVFIRPDESADDAIESFRSWVTKPYLTDLEVDWGALPVADIQPERLRDLGSGQTLTLVGRYLGTGSGDVVVRGRLGGSYWEQRVSVVLPESQSKHEALGSLWARARIEELLLSASEPTSDSLRAEVTSLGLEYRLMSPFTSFVAVDDSRVVNASGTSRTIQQALPVPEGVSFEGVFGKEGPSGLLAKGPSETEDHGAVVAEHAKDGEIAAMRVRAESPLQAVPPAAAAPQGVVGGVAGGVIGGVPSSASKGDGNRTVGYARMADAKAQRSGVLRESVAVVAKRPNIDLSSTVTGTTLSVDAIQDLPASGALRLIAKGPLYLAPGVYDSFDSEEAGDESARPRLADAALRVLADLADDGKLSASEGRPALAALLAAQRSSGAIAEDVVVHALATWALAEAAAALDHDAWVKSASTKAADYLVGLRQPSGWPAQPGGAVDPEATRWALLVVRGVRPQAASTVPVPSGNPSSTYVQLRAAIANARGRVPSTHASRRSPFDRLLGSIGNRRLVVIDL